METETSTIKNYNKQENEGQKILNKNNFFQDFTSLMRNNEFKKFYHNYFNDWSDIQTMIFYMKIYSTVEDLYYSQYKKEISDELMTYTLHKIITTQETRKIAVEIFKNFKGEESNIDKNRLTYFKSIINFESIPSNLLIKNELNKKY